MNALTKNIDATIPVTHRHITTTVLQYECESMRLIGYIFTHILCGVLVFLE